MKVCRSESLIQTAEALSSSAARRQCEVVFWVNKRHSFG